MTVKKKLLTAVFQDRTAAVQAYLWLQEHGYNPNEINVLMSDRTRAMLSEENVDESQIKARSMATEGVAAGGAIGTAIGATLASLVAVGTAALVIPGLGLIVAGPIVAGLAGGGAGAVAGGVIGGLIGMGIPESNATAYEEALRNGGVIFGIAPHSAKDEEMIREYFEQHHADNVVFA